MTVTLRNTGRPASAQEAFDHFDRLSRERALTDTESRALYRHMRSLDRDRLRQERRA